MAPPPRTRLKESRHRGSDRSGTTLTVRRTTIDEGIVYGPHDHCAYYDQHGNGQTSEDDDHAHTIEGGQIGPNNEDGHVHGITSTSCPRPITE